MKKTLFSALASCLLVPYLVAQGPAISWQKSLGGIAHDAAYSIYPTVDPGYIVAGSSTSTSGDVTGNHGTGDFWVTKIDANGSLIWQQSIGGTGDEIANHIQQVTGNIGGDFIIAGTSSSSDGDFAGNTQHGGGGDYAFVRLNYPNIVAIHKLYGGSGYDEACTTLPHFASGYMIAGYSDSNDGDITNPKGGPDFWIIRTGSDGAILKQKSYGGSGVDYANHMAQAFDGGFIVVGASESTDGDVTGGHGSYDFWVVRLDTGGVMTWQKTFGGSNSDVATSVQQTSDQGYIVAGYTLSNDGDVSGNHGGQGDFWVIKLSSNGTLQWQKTLGGSGLDKATSVRQTSDGGYVIGGSSNSTDGDVTGVHGADDFWAVKLDMNGNLLWQKAMGSSQSDEGHAACLNQAGDYLMAGFANGNDGDVSGYHGGIGDFWIVKLNGTATDVGDVQDESSLTAFPNPTNQSVMIEFGPNLIGTGFELVDPLGRTMVTGTIDAANYPISLEQFPAGHYFMHVHAQKSHTLRLVKL